MNPSTLSGGSANSPAANSQQSTSAASAQTTTGQQMLSTNVWIKNFCTVD